MPRALQTLTLDEARRVVAAGEAAAARLALPYNIAVVDAGGWLVCHARMDGAWFGSIDLAIHKAWTARAFDTDTGRLSGLAQSGQPLFGIHTTNGGKVVIFGGGLPIRLGDEVVGAVGASGGTVEQDNEVAEAAVAAFAAPSTG